VGELPLAHKVAAGVLEAAMPLARLDPIPQFLPQEAGEEQGKTALQQHNMLAEQAERFLAMRFPAELGLREPWAVERVELDQLLPGHPSTLEAEAVEVAAQQQQTEAQEVREQIMEVEVEVEDAALSDSLRVQAEREPMGLLWW
jgi:hypothetical protein